MNSCPEYKSLVDRYGDLETSQRASLHAHLEACASCTDYKAGADRTTHLLRALGKRLTPTDPVDQAFERMSLRLAASRRQMTWLLVFIASCVAAPFAMLLRGDLPLEVWGLFALALAAAGIGAWHIRRGQSAMLHLADRPDDFYATWQRDLEKRIRMLTGGGVYVAVWSIVFLFCSMWAPFDIVGRLVVLGAGFVLVFAALRAFVVELPQLKSELRLVQGAGGG